LLYIKNAFSASINSNPGEGAFKQADQGKPDHTRRMRGELWWFSGILAAKERR
jgi:hypothetical protein